MKALQLVDTEDRIEIVDMPKPKIGFGEVLVKLKAAALNHRDQWCREGKYPNIKFNTILGSDGAGIVEEIGEGVDSFWKGREVVINPNIDWGDNPAVQSASYKILGMPVNGTFAEYLAVPADRLQVTPDHLSFEQAAALPLAGLTAFRAVFTYGNVGKSHKVLINGIGGGVAQFCFLFCKATGAEVFVTSGTTQKLEKALTEGASGGFNYKDENWVNKAKEKGGYDIIIDSAGGNQFNHLIHLANPAGKIVFYGATAGLPDKVNLHKIFWNQLTVQGTTMGNDEEFVKMLRYVSEHQLKPQIDSVRRFDDIVSAFDDMKNGRQNGKLVVKMSS